MGDLYNPYTKKCDCVSVKLLLKNNGPDVVHRPWFANPCSKINTSLVHLTKQDPNNCIPGEGKKKISRIFLERNI